MFGLEDLKKTRYFQEVAEEAKLEGKLESVPGLLAIGLSAEQIAGALGLDVELVMHEEAKLEGKLESVPGLLAVGLSPEQIAGVFGLDVDLVIQAAAREQEAKANSNGE